MGISQKGKAPVWTLGWGNAGRQNTNKRIVDSAIRMQGLWLLANAKLKKKGQDRNPAPFLNPISYEKPKCIRQCTCRKEVRRVGIMELFSKILIISILRKHMFAWSYAGQVAGSRFYSHDWKLFPMDGKDRSWIVGMNYVVNNRNLKKAANRPLKKSVNSFLQIKH
jgi:hypothetical protein